jgi:2,4-dienoyl-CoA reductase (NADPH2)
MTQQFERLMQPGQIGPVKTRNRIIKTANGTSFMDFKTQGPGDRMVAYYERLAKGGVGYLIVESCGVQYPEGIQHVHYDGEKLLGGVQLHIDDDQYIPAFARIADAAHKHGCPCAVQLQHAGAWNPTGLLPKRDTAIASAFKKGEFPGPDFSECRAMTHDEVEAMIEIWISAALRVWRAGFDGVEINHGTCHQGATFLSRFWNHRTDEFGAQNFENRTRFLRRIVEGVKERSHGKFAVGVLMDIAEYRIPNAYPVHEGVEMAKLVADSGADGLSCRAHSYGHRGGLIQPDKLLYPEPPENLPEGMDWSNGGRGAAVPLCIAVKEKVKNIPVWTACRIDPWMGEEYLRKGSLDFVGMTRALLADPDLPNKVAAGELDDIRWCHGCLHCFDCRNKNLALECRINANLGREADPEYNFAPVEKKKKVLVVGGGPAGMEAARVAAQRGHEVVLYEKASYLGGLIPMAAIVKDKETEDLMKYLRYQVKQLKKEGVKVHMKTEVTADLVRKEKPDAVVVATGNAYSKFSVPGGDDKKVISAAKLHKQLKWLLKYLTPLQLQKLTHYYMPVGKSAAVVGGELHGAEVTEFLAKRNRKVVLVHNGPKSELGKGMTVDDLTNLWPWLSKKDVPIYTDVKYDRVTDKGLTITTKDGKTQTFSVDSILTTQELAPNLDLLNSLKGTAPEIYNIGSSREPGLIVDAVREGAKLGYAI